MRARDTPGGFRSVDRSLSLSLSLATWPRGPLKSPRYKTLGFRVTIITLRKLAPKNGVHFYRFKEGDERGREREDDDDDDNDDM